jgi:hypothetical protein
MKIEQENGSDVLCEEETEERLCWRTLNNQTGYILYAPALLGVLSRACPTAATASTPHGGFVAVRLLALAGLPFLVASSSA